MPTVSLNWAPPLLCPSPQLEVAVAVRGGGMSSESILLLMWFKKYRLYILGLTSKLKFNSDNKLPERGWSVPHLEYVPAERCQERVQKCMVGSYTWIFSQWQGEVISIWLLLIMRIRLWLLFAYRTSGYYAFCWSGGSGLLSFTGWGWSTAGCHE